MQVASREYRRPIQHGSNLGLPSKVFRLARYFAPCIPGSGQFVLTVNDFSYVNLIGQPFKRRFQQSITSTNRYTVRALLLVPCVFFPQPVGLVAVKRPAGNEVAITKLRKRPTNVVVVAPMRQIVRTYPRQCCNTFSRWNAFGRIIVFKSIGSCEVQLLVRHQLLKFEHGEVAPDFSIIGWLIWIKIRAGFDWHSRFYQLKFCYIRRMAELPPMPETWPEQRTYIGKLQHIGCDRLIQDILKDVPEGASGTPFHLDRKSTRLNSSHLGISYAVFCLKKKKNKE